MLVEDLYIVRTGFEPVTSQTNYELLRSTSLASTVPPPDYFDLNFLHYIWLPHI